MSIEKATVDRIIQAFTDRKDEHFIEQKNLAKFDLSKKEDRQFLSYVHGVGGYYVPFLNFLIKEVKPKHVVELGSWSGLSTLSMYDALSADASFHTVDLVKDQRYCPDHMHKDTRVHFLFGDVCSKEIIDALPRSIDFMFTDTLHFKYQFEDEFEIYQHLFADTALIAVDDIRSNDKGDFFKALPYDKWDLSELCHGSGWGLFLFKRKHSVEPAQQEQALYQALIRVWERKYNRLYSIYSEQIPLSQRLKNILKKLTPLYRVYTALYNKIHAYRKSTRVLNHNLKDRV